MLSITVNTLVDENDGISVGDVSLRDAIAYAATQTGFDTINFDPSLTASGPASILLSGPLTIDSDLTIQGPTDAVLSIDAQENSQVLEIDAGIHATINNLTITGGGDVDVGAGIYNDGGDLTLNQVSVISNSTRLLTSTSNDNGGGIYSLYGSLHIIDSTIDDNHARWNAGIAYYANDADDVLEITGSTISNNTALDLGGSGAFGGMGIFSSSAGAVLTVTNSTFSGNAAGSIAGIYVA